MTVTTERFTAFVGDAMFAFGALLLVLLVGLLLWIATVYLIDATQTSQAVRRNFPVIGRFRYFFEHIGKFFRQYFFAMDREELPFNRAQRGWVYRAAKDLDNTVAFGSTRDLRQPGGIIFVNVPFPTLGSAEGGTGAAPMTLIDDVGLPLRESLPLLVDKLEAHGLRDRVRVIASGKLVNPAQVAWALCMGADYVTTARGFMFALGCIQALQCNRNTCPTGITTHNPKLQKGLDPDIKAERVSHYVQHLVREVGLIAHACGLRSPRELRRHHARVVQPDGRSIALDKLYPPAASEGGRWP